MKYYLAGPMSWIPQFNIPVFDRATDALRANHFDIISPAELDSAEIRAAALLSENGDPTDVVSIETWGDMLARDVKLIADECGAIIFLDGWENSRGARLEAFVSILCDRKLYRYLGGSGGGIEEMSAKLVLTKIARHTNRDLNKREN